MGRYAKRHGVYFINGDNSYDFGVAIIWRLAMLSPMMRVPT